MDGAWGGAHDNPRDVKQNKPLRVVFHLPKAPTSGELSAKLTERGKTKEVLKLQNCKIKQPSPSPMAPPLPKGEAKDSYIKLYHCQHKNCKIDIIPL